VASNLTAFCATVKPTMKKAVTIARIFPLCGADFQSAAEWYSALFAPTYHLNLKLTVIFRIPAAPVASP
jgi:hypothetical protein